MQSPWKRRTEIVSSHTTEPRKTNNAGDKKPRGTRGTKVMAHSVYSVLFPCSPWFGFYHAFVQTPVALPQMRPGVRLPHARALLHHHDGGGASRQDDA